MSKSSDVAYKKQISSLISFTEGLLLRIRMFDKIKKHKPVYEYFVNEIENFFPIGNPKNLELIFCLQFKNYITEFDQKKGPKNKYDNQRYSDLFDQIYKKIAVLPKSIDKRKCELKRKIEKIRPKEKMFFDSNYHLISSYKPKNPNKHWVFINKFLNDRAKISPYGEFFTRSFLDDKVFRKKSQFFDFLKSDLLENLDQWASKEILLNNKILAGHIMYCFLGENTSDLEPETIRKRISKIQNHQKSSNDNTFKDLLNMTRN